MTRAVLMIVFMAASLHNSYAQYSLGLTSFPNAKGYKRVTEINIRYRPDAAAPVKDTSVYTLDTGGHSIQIHNLGTVEVLPDRMINSFEGGKIVDHKQLGASMSVARSGRFDSVYYDPEQVRVHMTFSYENGKLKNSQDSFLLKGSMCLLRSDHYEYDSNGLMTASTACIRRTDSGSCTSRIDTYRNVLHYKPSEVIAYSYSRGNLVTVTTRKLDNKGNVFRVSTKTTDNKEETVQTVRRSRSGNITRTVHIAKPHNKKWRVESEYDGEGKLSLVRMYSNGQPHSRSYYSYSK